MSIFDKIVVLNVENLITVSSKKGRTETIHKRKWYGLSFCIEGQITYTQDGEKFVSDKNHAVILPKGKTYSLYGDKKGVFPVINFTCLNFKCDKITVLPISKVEPFISNFERLKKLFLFKKNHNQIMSIFYEILNKLSLENGENSILSNAVNYLENNLTEEISNKQLADVCNISEVYFRKLFVKRYGKTPKQYVIDARISKAKQLLTEGTLKINAVSEACGFQNPYHFCRSFKKRVGLTPTEYMKDNKVYKI